MKRSKLKKNKKHSTTSLSKNAKMFILAAVVVGIFGFYSLQNTGSKDVSKGREIQLPDFATRSAKSTEAYTIALRMPEVLEKIPCYCNCYRLGHTSLRSCFINDYGSFDTHGANCEMCMNEVLDTKEWLDQGLSLKEIRYRIDSKYGGGKYGQGTPTPPVV